METHDRPCRHVAEDRARLLRSHLPGCDLASCNGCEPCPERHCQVDRCHHHVTVNGRGRDQTCATCLHEARTRIAAIGVMATALLGEALMMSLGSNAAALAGPTADPETWGYRRLSALANRIDPSWLDDQVDLHHPSWVLGTWEREARRHLEQTLSPGTSRPTLTEARDYLDQHLTRLAHDSGFAFAELAEDVRLCHNHVERVLHLEVHTDRGAPCPACGRGDLEKSWGAAENDDRWTCPRCQQWWTEKDYWSKVDGTYLAVAAALTASQIQEQYRVPESTVRRWASGWRDRHGNDHEPVVRRRGYDGQRRQLYDVGDVLARRDEQDGAGQVG